MPRFATRPLSLLVVSGALAIGATAPAQAFTPPIGSDKGSVTRVDPGQYYDMSSPYLVMTADRFSLTIDGVEIAQFSELAGISSAVERKPATVTLKRGKSNDMGLFAWHQSVVEGQLAAARNSTTLTMYAPDGAATGGYYLESAWPSEVAISGLKAGASEVLYETVTLTADDIQRIAT
jgi:T4-like virus tail tube protein gp19